LVNERLPAGDIPPLHHHLHPSDADGLAITGEAHAIRKRVQLSLGHRLKY